MSPAPTAAATGKQPYHHGDLRNALVGAAVDLARDGGPQAVVLRETARRVGVSPNAAYRHFTDLPALLDAVRQEAFTALADAMKREIARNKSSDDEVQDAWKFMCAVGRGYVHFALREPGLFAVAFDGTHDTTAEMFLNADTGPKALLRQALEGLVAVGSLPADQVQDAATTAWSTVHGLSLLLLGPMSGLAPKAREGVIEATLTQIGTGLLGR